MRFQVLFVVGRVARLRAFDFEQYQLTEVPAPIFKLWAIRGSRHNIFPLRRVVTAIFQPADFESDLMSVMLFPRDLRYWCRSRPLAPLDEVDKSRSKVCPVSSCLRVRFSSVNRDPLLDLVAGRPSRDGVYSYD